MKQILAALLFSGAACIGCSALAAGTDETPTAPAAVNDLEEGRKAVQGGQQGVPAGPDHLPPAT